MRQPTKRALSPLSPTQPLCCAGVEIHGEDVLKDADLRLMMKEFSQWPTFPQLYVKGTFVGGCDIVTAMNQAGELKELLSDVARRPATQ